MMPGPHTNQCVSVIVNADDFGFFDGVCAGILEAGASGRLTATGIMANGPALERWLPDLLTMPQVSPGIHLNATLGEPLTEQMRRTSLAATGIFSGKAALVKSLLLGRLPTEALLFEWRSQIERCRLMGVQPTFLNSHEHVHMLPSLYRQVRSLADEFGIKHVRAPRPEWRYSLSVGGVIRSSALAASRAMLARRVASEPLLIGLGPSGRMNLKYLCDRLEGLERGHVYELMCHPGRMDGEALREPKVAAYHDWEGELQVLLSRQFADLLDRGNIKLVSFRELSTDASMRSADAMPRSRNERCQ